MPHWAERTAELEVLATRLRPAVISTRPSQEQIIIDHALVVSYTTRGLAKLGASAQLHWEPVAGGD